MQRVDRRLGIERRAPEREDDLGLAVRGQALGEVRPARDGALAVGDVVGDDERPEARRELDFDGRLQRSGGRHTWKTKPAGRICAGCQTA